MNIINAGFEIIEPHDPLRHIELCGRVCYKSESRITEETAGTFCRNIIRSGHESVLEHYNYVVQYNGKVVKPILRAITTISTNGGRCFLRVTRNHQKTIISGNVRAWRDFVKLSGVFPDVFTDSELFSDLVFDSTVRGGFIIADPFKLKDEAERVTHETVTVRFIVDRGVSHEFIRHRTASFSQESTRYCNYGGGNVTFIRPVGMDDIRFRVWRAAMSEAESTYNLLIAKGAKPQEARAVLPTSVKTELIMTATVSDWEHFFELRCSHAAHPQAREVAEPLRAEFIRRGILLNG